MRAGILALAVLAALCTLLTGATSDTMREAWAAPAPVGAAIAPRVGGTGTVVDTGQTRCYDSEGEIAPPRPGEPYHGQDAQHPRNPSRYTRSADRTTVRDEVTGLTWMSGPTPTPARPTRADKMTLGQARAWVGRVNATRYGGYDDWRLPTIKELYSLIRFDGTAPSGYRGTDTSALTPFIDTRCFRFSYGDTRTGERIIDAQYASSTLYLCPSFRGGGKLFGVNFADGRIKGYDLSMPGGRTEKTFFVQLVRGSTGYAENQLRDNRDGTVTDVANGLMWTGGDSGRAMNWREALAWGGDLNRRGYLGHRDWRLPSAKELQSLVDYGNAPDFNGKPAIDTRYFTCTPIVNENGDKDYPYYWTSTTHAGWAPHGTRGGQAVYIAFGRALGWPMGASAWVDVHGAGSQRSDPKVGPQYDFATILTVVKNGKVYTGHAHGPQGDAIRGLNFVRLVRDLGP